MKHTIFLAAVLLTAGSSGYAQEPPKATGPSGQAQGSTAAANCTPTQTNPQGEVEPRSTTGQSGENLGDKLARSGGVMCPPAGVDPDMHVPAPSVGTMPVIKPPGSPGGDPSVQPK